MQKYTKEWLAQFFSLILGFPWIVVLVFIFITQSNLNPAQMAFFSIAFPFLHIGVPLGYLTYAMKKGTISDIDITKREERYGILTVIFIKNIISLALVYFFGTYELLHLVLPVMVAFGAAYIITFFWKISLHMTFNTVGIMLINIVYGFDNLYLFALLPVVFWSRYVQKKHTATQLLAGFALAASITSYLWLFFLK